jgi:hypothetical protein
MQVLQQKVFAKRNEDLVGSKCTKVCTEGSRAFFTQIKVIHWFYIIRGLELHPIVHQDTRQHSFKRIAAVLYFTLFNCIRLAGTLVTAWYFLQSLSTSSKSFIRRIYSSTLYIIEISSLVGNVIANVRRRCVYLAWQSCVDNGLLAGGPELTRKQRAAFNACQVASIASALFSVYYMIENDWDLGPLPTQILMEASFFELTYLPDVSLLLMVHFVQHFQWLQGQAKEVFKTSKLTTGEKVERARWIYFKWSKLKRLVADVGNAACFYWIPFMVWAITSISFKMNRLTESVRKFSVGYDVCGVLLRMGLILFMAEVGHVLKDAVEHRPCFWALFDKSFS